MSIWTDNKGLTLYPTSDEKVVFLEVDSKRDVFVAPFMKLTEIGATKADGEPGWFIPKSKVPYINPLLNNLQHLSSVPDLDLAEDKYAYTVRPTEPRNPKHALVHWVGFSELRLLLLLTPTLDSRLKKVLAVTTRYVPSTYKEALDEQKITYYSGDPLDQTITLVLIKNLEYLSILHQYVRHRDVDLKKGDIMRYSMYLLNSAYSAMFADSNSFIGLSNVYGGCKSMPSQFKVPEFPIMYWHSKFDGAFNIGRYMYPDLDMKGLVAEYDNDPAPLGKEIEGVEAKDDEDEEKKSMVAMKYILPAPINGLREFYIYFIANEKLPYREVMRHLSAFKKGIFGFDGFEVYNDNTLVIVSDYEGWYVGTVIISHFDEKTKAVNMTEKKMREAIDGVRLTTSHKADILIIEKDRILIHFAEASPPDMEIIVTNMQRFMGLSAAVSVAKSDDDIEAVFEYTPIYIWGYPADTKLEEFKRLLEPFKPAKIEMKSNYVMVLFNNDVESEDRADVAMKFLHGKTMGPLGKSVEIIVSDSIPPLPAPPAPPTKLRHRPEPSHQPPSGLHLGIGTIPGRTLPILPPPN